MKYRHAFHAGNFADVHKHVALVALLRALQRKEKGFLYVDACAGRGLYDLAASGAGPAAEWRGGIGRLASDAAHAPERAEIDDYLAVLEQVRTAAAVPHGYPGSPLLAAWLLRPQDRGIAIELLAAEAAALHARLPAAARVRVEQGDGLQRLRALLPPPERRALVLIDPPYEESEADFERVAAALEKGLRHFATGVFAAWHPIKERRRIDAWRAGLERRLARPLLYSDLLLYPADSRVSLNGSGLVIVNPPHLVAERMRAWLPALYEQLAVGAGGGALVTVRAASERGSRVSPPPPPAAR